MIIFLSFLERIIKCLTLEAYLKKAKVALVSPGMWVFGGGGLLACAMSVPFMSGAIKEEGAPLLGLMLLGGGIGITWMAAKLLLPLCEDDYEIRKCYRETERKERLRKSGRVAAPIEGERRQASEAGAAQRPNMGGGTSRHLHTDRAEKYVC